MSQDVKLHIFQQIHTPSGNRLIGSYFQSVTGYDKRTSFTALNYVLLKPINREVFHARATAVSNGTHVQVKYSNATSRQ